MSKSRHPQTDGLSEIINRMVENSIRFYCDDLLPAAKFAYNSAVTEDIGMTPFEMDLRYLPKSPLDRLYGSTEKNEQV